MENPEYRKKRLGIPVSPVLYILFCFAAAIGINVMNLSYVPDRPQGFSYFHETPKKDKPHKSYFDGIKPQKIKDIFLDSKKKEELKYGVAVITDLDKDGEFDLEEEYAYPLLSPLVPLEVNVKKEYEKFLEYKVENLIKIMQLKKSNAFKIVNEDYFRSNFFRYMQEEVQRGYKY